MNDRMNIIKQICDAESIGCRSLNKAGLVLDLMETYGMDTERILISEIPVDWDNQVVADFEYDGDWYEFAAGISADGSGKYFEEVRRWSEFGDGELIPFEFFNPDAPVDVYDACERAEKALSDAHIGAEVWGDNSGELIVCISWGDWKHSHLYADHILATLGFQKEREVVTEEDGSDCYSSEHIYKWR